LWELLEYDQRCMAFFGDELYIGNGDGTVMCVVQRTGGEK
jgi:hypothetical protein